MFSYGVLMLPKTVKDLSYRHLTFLIPAIWNSYVHAKWLHIILFNIISNCTYSKIYSKIYTEANIIKTNSDSIFKVELIPYGVPLKWLYMVI